MICSVLSFLNFGSSGATRKRTVCPNDAFNRAEGASGNGFTKCVVQKNICVFFGKKIYICNTLMICA